MKALIRTKNGFYCSTVFAFSDKAWKSLVIAFNENASRLVFVPYCNLTHGIRRDVLLFDESEENWVEKNGWRGWDFIVSDMDLLRDIKTGRDIPFDVLEKCKSLQTLETFEDRIDLDGDSAIEKLMSLTFDFHDAVIKSVEHDGDIVRVVFRCWSCRVIIEFIDIVDCDEGSDISWGSNCIFNAAMCFDGGNIKWFVDGFCYNEYENQACFFVAKKARYKIDLID